MSRRSRSANPRRSEKFAYVFGSSTPRDLSYLDLIPWKYRVYDTPLPTRMSRRDLDALQNEWRHTSPMRSGRSPSQKRNGMPFGFGSATPREFSYLETLDPEFRVYDVKLIPVNGDRRSKTTSFSSAGSAGPAVRRSSSLNLVGHQNGGESSREGSVRMTQSAATSAPFSKRTGSTRRCPASKSSVTSKRVRDRSQKSIPRTPQPLTNGTAKEAPKTTKPPVIKEKRKPESRSGAPVPLPSKIPSDGGEIDSAISDTSELSHRTYTEEENTDSRQQTVTPHSITPSKEFVAEVQDKLESSKATHSGMEEKKALVVEHTVVKQTTIVEKAVVELSPTVEFSPPPKSPDLIVKTVEITETKISSTPAVEKELKAVESSIEPAESPNLTVSPQPEAHDIEVQNKSQLHSESLTTADFISKSPEQPKEMDKSTTPANSPSSSPTERSHPIVAHSVEETQERPDIVIDTVVSHEEIEDSQPYSPALPEQKGSDDELSDVENGRKAEGLIYRAEHSDLDVDASPRKVEEIETELKSVHVVNLSHTPEELESSDSHVEKQWENHGHSPVQLDQILSEPPAVPDVVVADTKRDSPDSDSLKKLPIHENLINSHSSEVEIVFNDGIAESQMTEQEKVEDEEITAHKQLPDLQGMATPKSRSSRGSDDYGGDFEPKFSDEEPANGELNEEDEVASRSDGSQRLSVSSQHSSGNEPTAKVISVDEPIEFGKEKKEDILEHVDDSLSSKSPSAQMVTSPSPAEQHLVESVILSPATSPVPLGLLEEPREKLEIVDPMVASFHQDLSPSLSSSTEPFQVTRESPIVMEPDDVVLTTTTQLTTESSPEARLLVIGSEIHYKFELPNTSDSRHSPQPSPTADSNDLQIESEEEEIRVVHHMPLGPPDSLNFDSDGLCQLPIPTHNEDNRNESREEFRADSSSTDRSQPFETNTDAPNSRGLLDDLVPMVIPVVSQSPVESDRSGGGHFSRSSSPEQPTQSEMKEQSEEHHPQQLFRHFPPSPTAARVVTDTLTTGLGHEEEEFSHIEVARSGQVSPVEEIPSDPNGNQFDYHQRHSSDTSPDVRDILEVKDNRSQQWNDSGSETDEVRRIMGGNSDEEMESPNDSHTDHKEISMIPKFTAEMQQTTEESRGHGAIPAVTFSMATRMEENSGEQM